jgi:SPP1 gp7 family putative phage head morphogenesis protein
MSETLALNKLAYETKGFEEFRKEAMDIITINREQWLRVEYDSLTRGAVMGEQWRKMEEDSDLYPYWVYHGVMDDRERDEHVALEGLIFKIGDPEGDAVFPPSDWNCRCTGDPTDDTEGKEVSKGSDYLDKNDPETGKPYVDEQFRFNPGVQPMPNEGEGYFDVLSSANSAGQLSFDFE